MKKYFIDLWNRLRGGDVGYSRTMPTKPRDPDAELAELAALLEGCDTSPETLERVSKLISGTDSEL